MRVFKRKPESTALDNTQAYAISRDAVPSSGHVCTDIGLSLAFLSSVSSVAVRLWLAAIMQQHARYVDSQIGMVWGCIGSLIPGVPKGQSHIDSYMLAPHLPAGVQSPRRTCTVADVLIGISFSRHTKWMQTCLSIATH